MPYPLNNVSTQDQYTPAVTAQFPIGQPHFSLQVYKAAVYYKLIAFTPPNDYHEVPTEHFLAPILAGFNNPLGEGLAAGEIFGGIMLRSAVAGVPAQVTVI